MVRLLAQRQLGFLLFLVKLVLADWRGSSLRGCASFCQLTLFLCCLSCLFKLELMKLILLTALKMNG